MTIRRIAVAVAAVAALSVPGTRPADAHTATCTGVWAMTTAAPLFFAHTTYPVTNTAFVMIMTEGFCTPGPGHTVTMNATLSGYCDFAVGQGTTTDAHRFRFTAEDETMTFSGQVTGGLSMTPDQTTAPPQSCTTGATRFVLAGTVALTHTTP